MNRARQLIEAVAQGSSPQQVLAEGEANDLARLRTDTYKKLQGLSAHGWAWHYPGTYSPHEEDSSVVGQWVKVISQFKGTQGSKYFIQAYVFPDGTARTLLHRGYGSHIVSLGGTDKVSAWNLPQAVRQLMGTPDDEVVQLGKKFG